MTFKHIGFGLPGWLPAAAALLLCEGAATARGDAFLVRNGQPQAEIVIAQPPARTVRLAADELQAYVEKISGARLTITNAPSAAVPVQIYVGRSARTDKLGITDAGLDFGAFRMVSGKNWLVLLGRDTDFVPREPHLRNFTDYPRVTAEWDKLTGETYGYPHTQVFKAYNRTLNIWEQDGRGSINAVYEFLRMQGVRWYLPDPIGEIVPKHADIPLPKIDKTVRPDFALRWPYQYGRRFSHEAATRDEILWQLRLGLDEAPALIGLGDIGHGIIELLLRDETKKAHPEYYALWGGQRATDGEGKPCLSSEGLFQANVKYVRACFDIFDEPLVSVMPSDGYGALCQCELCKGKDTPARGRDGLLSDYVWDYVNRVATEVYKTHPGKKVMCFAYGAYALPPTNIARLSPNLIVGICQARRDFHDPKPRQYMVDLRKAWQAKMPDGNRQTVLYEYFLHTIPTHPYAGMPVFFPHVTARDLRELKGFSRGEFIDFYRDPAGLRALAVDGLNLYVTARLWWDADQDVDALLNEYYADFYGPAREEMKALVEYSEANWMDMRRNAGTISKALELLAKVEAAVAPDSVYGKRVALLTDYMRPLKGLRERLIKGRQGVPEAHITARVDAKVTIDGKLDEEVWHGSVWTNSLGDLQTGRTPAARTSFAAFWADDALYLGISCQDPDPQHLRIGTTRNDDTSIWRGDYVDILLETQTHSYYQFTINPAGAMSDLDDKDHFNPLWASGATAAAHIGDEGWTVEIRIPAAGDRQEELDPLHGVSGSKPTEAHPWFFNVCRQRPRDNGSESSAFSPTGKAGFHELLKFGKLYVR